jgi:hypothetical protein
MLIALMLCMVFLNLSKVTVVIFTVLQGILLSDNLFIKYGRQRNSSF